MFRSVIPALLAVALTACGGGGGNSVPNTTDYRLAPNETVTLSLDTTSLLATVTPTTMAPTVNTTRLLLSTVGSILYPNSFIPSVVGGDFKGNGSKYAVVSGWIVNQTGTPAVKIYKFNNDGTASDATVEVLGANFSISVHYPVVSDFNRDGVDDIFFAGFTDAPYQDENLSVVFLSRPGLPHQKLELDGLVHSHGSTAVDINQDGWLDVINSAGDMWINNTNNGFNFVRRTIGQSFAGSGVCSGDFDGSGNTQLVVTDFTDGSNNVRDTWIFKFRPDLTHYKVANLPTPIFDRTSVGSSYSHDVTCMVADLNNDGRQDIVVISYSHNLALVRASGPQSMVQVYYNQGNYVFSDSAESKLTGYYQGVLASYTPKILDFNNDGRPDIWIANTSSTTPGAQIWLNNGDETFAQKNQNEILSLLTEYRILSNGIPNTLGTMMPIKINNKWNFVVTSFTGSNSLEMTLNIGYANTQWSF